MKFNKFCRAAGSAAMAAAMSLSMLPATALAAEAETDRVEELLDTMSLDEKITQMLMMDFRYWDDGSGAGQVGLTVMNDQVAEILSEYKFGSFILFAQNIVETEATYDLTDAIQEAATKDGGLPMLICTDQEGGSVFRLGSGTALPGNMALGATGSTDDAYKAGRIIGSEMKAVGINATLAPVVDVNNNPNNPVIGLRSYSDDPQLVGELASAEIQGLADYDVIGCAKHFPGHGDTATDSHYGLPSVDKSKEVLMENELKPYTVAIEEGIDMIMTAHILYPQLDDSTLYSNKTGQEESLPATMSKAIITDLLKGEMGFDGVVSTDAMNMSAIAATWDQTQATVNAIAAGADLICMPVSPRSVSDMEAVDAVIDGIKDAIDEGTITMDRVNDANRRILTLKEEKGILDYEGNETSKEEALEIVGGTLNRAVEREIAADAVTVVKNENNTLPLQLDETSKVVAFVPYTNEQGQLVMAWNRGIEAGTVPQGASIETIRFSSAALSDTMKAKIDEADYIYLHSEISNASRMNGGHWLSSFILNTLDYAEEAGTTAIVASVDKPYDVQSYDKADAIMAVYGCKGSSVDPTEAIVGGTTTTQAAYGPNIIAGMEVALGTLEAKGTLPVTIYKFDTSTKTYDMNTVVYPRGFGLTISTNVETANKSLLLQSIYYAENIVLAGGLDGVNEIVVNAFNEALEEAKSVYSATASSQEKVDEAWKNLSEKIQMLNFTSNKADLAALVAECEALDLNDYKAFGKEEFEAALEYAKEVLADPAALDEVSIKAAYDRLSAAKAVLIRIGDLDTSLLEALISAVDGVDLSLYIPAGQDEFNTALANAKTVLTEAKTQAEIDNAVSALNNAWMNLRFKPSEDMIKTLQNFVNSVNALNRSAYKAETWAVIEAKKDEVANALNDVNLSRDEAQALIDSLANIEAIIAAPDAVEETVTPSVSETVTPSVTTTAADTTDKAVAATTASSVKTGVSVMAFGALAAAAAGGLCALNKRRNKN